MINRGFLPIHWDASEMAASLLNGLMIDTINGNFRQTLRMVNNS
jgi:hypothetical protein